MTDRIEKALDKLSFKERAVIKRLLQQIQAGQLPYTDLKKLKGYHNIFRVRKGRLRIIFQVHDHTVKILAVEKRSDTTYQWL